MKIYTLRRKGDGFYLKSRSRWVAELDSARIFGRKQDAAAAVRFYRQSTDDISEIDIIEHVCLPALSAEQVYVALPAEGDGVLGDWLESYGLISAAMTVRKRTLDGKPL